MDMETQKEKKERFSALAERFQAATDAGEVERLGEEIGQFVFGNQFPGIVIRSEAKDLCNLLAAPILRAIA
jgi:hypothetical protein